MAKDHLEHYQNYKVKDEAEIEQEFLKGIKDPDLGVYCDIFSAKSKIDGQNGGVVTALLFQGIQEDAFDAAIVVRGGEGYNAEAVVATNTIEVLAAKGTKYLRINVTKKLRELISQGKKRIVVVCTPCEAKAARKLQQTLKNDCEIKVIGLFCFEAYNSAKIKEEIKKRFGVDLDKAQKTQIQQGKFSAFVDGKNFSCKIKELNGAVDKACHFCDDFTARFADISVGSVGSKPGYSTIIVRSKAGEKLLKNEDFTKEIVDKKEVIRLSNYKKERTKNSLAAAQTTRNKHYF